MTGEVRGAPQRGAEHSGGKCAGIRVFRECPVLLRVQQRRGLRLTVGRVKVEVMGDLAKSYFCVIIGTNICSIALRD